MTLIGTLSFGFASKKLTFGDSLLRAELHRFSVVLASEGPTQAHPNV